MRDKGKRGPGLELGRGAPRGRERVKVSLPTVALNSHTVGNALFNRAVFAIGLDGSLVRRELSALLAVLGTAPRDVTADDLGALLPEIDKRLRLLVDGDQADRSIAKLRKLLLTHEED